MLLLLPRLKFVFDHAGKENPALKGSETTFLSRSEQTEKLPNKASVQFPLIREKEKKKKLIMKLEEKIIVQS